MRWHRGGLAFHEDVAHDAGRGAWGPVLAAIRRYWDGREEEGEDE